VISEVIQAVYAAYLELYDLLANYLTVSVLSLVEFRSAGSVSAPPVRRGLQPWPSGLR